MVVSGIEGLTANDIQIFYMYIRIYIYIYIHIHMYTYIEDDARGEKRQKREGCLESLPCCQGEIRISFSDSIFIIHSNL